MNDEKLTISIKEGIHIPLELCHTCPYFNTCEMAGSEIIHEKNKRMEKLFLHKTLFSTLICDHYKIPKLPIFIYDNPHTMYEKLGFFWSQLNYCSHANKFIQSMYNDPLIILNTTKGVLMQQVYEGVLINVLEKLEQFEQDIQ
jgi:hypothetical protein